nr:HD domain-containing protein [Geobacter sp. SVR]
MNSTIEIIRQVFPPHCHRLVFLVGGSVRDHLLGREIRDIDLAAALAPAQLRAAGFRLVEGKSTDPIWFASNPSFGTIELTALADTPLLDADLVRRDFTVNAMAMDLSGRLIDPLGGRGDLEAGLLRACTKRTFADDPLRIFRAFRFEADGWRLSDDTGELIRSQDWSGSFETIPVERFSREMVKALSAPHPERFFRDMLEYGVGRQYLPELFRMGGVPAGPLAHHPEGDLCTHSLQVLERLSSHSDSPLARFCALFHDIGKLATDPSEYPAHHRHCLSGFDMARPFNHRLRLPAAFGTALAWTSLLHGHLNRWSELRDSTRITTVEKAVKGGIAGILPLVSAADKGAEGEPADWTEIMRIVRMNTTRLGIEPDRLTSIPAPQRPDLILQRRIEYLRRHRCANQPEG